MWRWVFKICNKGSSEFLFYLMGLFYHLFWVSFLCFEYVWFLIDKKENKKIVAFVDQSVQQLKFAFIMLNVIDLNMNWKFNFLS